MQRLSLQLKGTLLWTVYGISEQWIPDTSHMNTDLMCSASLKSAGNIGIVSKALENLIMRDSLSSVLVINTHLFPIDRMSPDRRVNRTAVFLQIPADNSMIDPLDRMHF